MPARRLYPIPAVKLPKPRRKAKPDLPEPKKPTFARDEVELLSGEVNGLKASMPEERFARALQKKNIAFEFRRTIVAPRGLPGWLELDFLVSSYGLLYAIEADTAFTHRGKQRKDVLHDAIVLADLRKEGINIWPTVIHLDGESDMIDQKAADATVARLFI